MKRIVTFALLVFVSVFLTGCASTDPENVSERPWNAPKNWEHGLPGGMMNQRY